MRAGRMEDAHYSTTVYASSYAEGVEKAHAAAERYFGAGQVVRITSSRATDVDGYTGSLFAVDVTVSACAP